MVHGPFEPTERPALSQRNGPRLFLSTTSEVFVTLREQIVSQRHKTSQKQCTYPFVLVPNETGAKQMSAQDVRLRRTRCPVPVAH